MKYIDAFPCNLLSFVTITTASVFWIVSVNNLGMLFAIDLRVVTLKIVYWTRLVIAPDFSIPDFDLVTNDYNTVTTVTDYRAIVWSTRYWRLAKSDETTEVKRAHSRSWLFEKRFIQPLTGLSSQLSFSSCPPVKLRINWIQFKASSSSKPIGWHSTSFHQWSLA